MNAVPIEDRLWCVECDDTHDFMDGKVVMHEAVEACPAIDFIACNHPLPEGWDRDFHARYGDRSTYELIPRYSDPIPGVHFAMYYLEPE